MIYFLFIIISTITHRRPGRPAAADRSRHRRRRRLLRARWRAACEISLLECAGQPGPRCLYCTRPRTGLHGISRPGATVGIMMTCHSPGGCCWPKPAPPPPPPNAGAAPARSKRTHKPLPVKHAMRMLCVVYREGGYVHTPLPVTCPRYIYIHLWRDLQGGGYEGMHTAESRGGRLLPEGGRG